MNQERLLQVILAPVLSEKSNRLGEKGNKVVFRVVKDATKPEIAAAVAMLFNATVTGVSVVNVKGKTKRVGRSFGKRKDWKKAYVTLAQENAVDLTDLSSVASGV
jgi:large subunit ribosomal protein L23